MNFIKCEKLEKSMAELQLSIAAEAFKGAVADVFKIKELPALVYELAQDCSEYDTLEEY